MQTVSPLPRASIVFFATVALALASAAAHADEATQFDLPQASALTRAEMQSRPDGRSAAVSVTQIGDATVFADMLPSAVDRAVVRAEARQAARDPHHQALYLGA